MFLYVDKGGSFSDDSETELLRVEESGENPVMYFQVDVDKEYGYEVRRVDSEPQRR